MRYVIIEDFCYVSLVTDSVTGQTEIFDSREEAESAATNCQNPVIVELNG